MAPKPGAYNDFSSPEYIANKKFRDDQAALRKKQSDDVYDAMKRSIAEAKERARAGQNKPTYSSTTASGGKGSPINTIRTWIPDGGYTSSGDISLKSLCALAFGGIIVYYSYFRNGYGLTESLIAGAVMAGIVWVVVAFFGVILDFLRDVIDSDNSSTWGFVLGAGGAAYYLYYELHAVGWVVIAGGLLGGVVGGKLFHVLLKLALLAGAIYLFVRYYGS